MREQRYLFSSLLLLKFLFLCVLFLFVAVSVLFFLSCATSHCQQQQTKPQLRTTQGRVRFFFFYSYYDSVTPNQTTTTTTTTSQLHHHLTFLPSTCGHTLRSKKKCSTGAFLKKRQKLQNQKGSLFSLGSRVLLPLLPFVLPPLLLPLSLLPQTPTCSAQRHLYFRASPSPRSLLVPLPPPFSSFDTYLLVTTKIFVLFFVSEM